MLCAILAAVFTTVSVTVVYRRMNEQKLTKQSVTTETDWMFTSSELKEAMIRYIQRDGYVMPEGASIIHCWGSDGEEIKNFNITLTAESYRK